MMRKTYEEIGREADTALRAHDAAQSWVENNLCKPLDEVVTMSIRGANWNEGTLQLQGHLNRLLASNVVDILGGALAAMKEEADEAVRQARAAFADGEIPPPTRSVPRGHVIGEPDEEGSRKRSGPVNLTPEAVSAARAAFDLLPQPAKELLGWINENPGQIFAKSSAATALRTAGFFAMVNNSPVITEAGRAALLPAAPILP